MRRDFSRGGAGAHADHRVEVRIAAALGAVGLVNSVIDRPLDRLEVTFFVMLWLM